MANDLRNDLAKARDVYLDTFLGKEACDLSTLTGQRAAFYLRNRIEAAFVAGWNAKEAHVPALPKSQEPTP